MVRQFLARCSALWAWRRKESELDEEIRFHLAEEAEERVTDGVAPDQADAAARRDFGNVVLVREATREVWGWGVAERLIQDFRYARRTMHRHPGFSAAVVLTLAVASGANTAIFTVVNGLLLRPLPVAEPERLALMATSDPDKPHALPMFGWSFAMWREIRQRPQLFDGAFGYSYSRFNLAAGGETEFVDGLWVTGTFFETLGVSASLGRLLTDADDRRGGGDAGPVAVISDEMWRRRFDGATDVVGRTLTVERVPLTIVGVLPRSFAGPVAGRVSDIVIPVGMASVLDGPIFLDHAGVHWLTIMARLKRNQTLATATAALAGVQPQIRAASLPPWDRDRLETYLRNPLILLPAARGNPLAPLRLRSERPLLAMQLAVVLIMIIACANIANLMLSRAVSRRREMSVRLALGASRSRLRRQLFVESLVLASVGAAGGLLLALWGTPLVVRFFLTDANGAAVAIAPDFRVLGFTVATALAAAVLFGLIPAGRATRVAPIEALKEAGNVAGAHLRLASAFVVGQVGLSVVLVVVGGLLIRTYANLATMDLGFQSGGVLVVDVDALKAQVRPANRLMLFEQVRRAVLQVPGITSAAFADLAPVTGNALAGQVEVSGAPLTRGRETFVNRVGPGWFGVYGMPMLRGRDFTAADHGRGKRVVVVNQAFAREFLNGGDPLGRFVTQLPAPPGQPPVASEIVGVTTDAVYESLRASVPATMYLPFDQIGDELLSAGAAPESASLSVRAGIAPSMVLTRSIAAAIEQVDPSLDLTFRTMPDIVGRSIALERALAIVSGFFGAVSLLLAAIGLYGVTSYAVGRRRSEIGIRMALGATRAVILRQIVARVLVLVGVGVLSGVGVSFWASPLLSALLHAVDPGDSLTLIGAVTLLTGFGALAGLVPAWRASRVDPMVALRYE
jgi:predicted permease